MDIKILQGIKAAESAAGVVVIIDVLRACTTIPILLQQGVKSIIPVETLEEVSKYSRADYLLIGEVEDGKQDTLFHYNNSPSEVLGKSMNGADVILRSNNATQAIAKARNADEVLLASFLNAQAVAHYIRERNPAVVSLVALGRKGEPGLEDDLCAEVLQAEVLGLPYDFSAMEPRIQACDCAVLVRETLGKPQDVTMALELNTSSIVPKVIRENEGFVIISI
ncbi:MAG: 2-phosphosulfolactate phosphatase [Candidatus Doudnabacteria bacterium]|nr:2-phosphosulfolactate phosphatase [Candidatus Doudnabacteria bacterium]